ncbi:MAG: IS5 family transposase [Polyangiales bacterium]|jgi:IS5 family transposase
MNSRVHPTYKTKYHVSNWAKYDQALVQRGDITLWISSDAMEAWNPRPSRKRGGQRKYSDIAIETALTLRLVFHLPLRQAEGFLRSILGLMDVGLEAPDHTTLSRRSRHLDTVLHPVPTTGPIHLIVDSTGLSIVGEGEWAAAKRGGNGKRGWKKLHLGVDRSGAIVAQVLTDGNADDAATAPELIDQVNGRLASFTADAAYDTTPVYDAALARGAKVIIPPTRMATGVRRRRLRSNARDRTIKRVREVGRRQWKKESGHHRQGTVENTFFRCKSIIGDRLRARHPRAMEVEALLACNILNRMLQLGRPVSVPIGA